MSNSVFVDIGNSFTKWHYEDSYFKTPTNNFEFSDLPSVSKVWSSNVSSKIFKEYEADVFFINTQKKYKSLESSYKNPSQLGSDRWLAMIASYEINQNKSFIVLDIGTAITIDLVEKGVHKGGLIAPGLSLIQSTINAFPCIEISGINNLGSSTEDAWSIGTNYMVVSFINKKIDEMTSHFPNIDINITGGGFNYLKNYLDFNHNYYDNLVLDGIKLYAEYMG